jgi:hypothetical protein
LVVEQVAVALDCLGKAVVVLLLRQTPAAQLHYMYQRAGAAAAVLME